MMNPFMSYTQSFNESMTKDDREDAERRMATARPINAGIASPAAIQASQSGDAIQETQDAIAAAFKALSVSRSQGTVNVGSFNFARRELLNAKDALAVAKSRATPGEQVLMSQLEEQVDTIQGEVNIQLRYLQTSAAKSNMTKDDREDAERRMATAKPVTAGIASSAAIAQSNKSKEDREISNAYKTPGYRQPVYPSQVRQPAAYTPIPNVITASPVIIPGTKDAREAVAGTDWAKLALQVGAAYLLLA
jgi:DNA-nicking Smr family endonuclease